MSKIDTEILRSRDERLLKVGAQVDYRGSFDRFSLELTSASGNLPIVSTSAGSIIENKVFSSQKNFVQIFADLIDVDELDCLISYFRGQELIHFETLPIVLKNTGVIQKDTVVLENISSIDAGYIEKTEHINKTYALFKTSWRAFVSVDNEILIRFTKRGSDKTYVSFGEITPNLLASDLIFSVDHNTSEVIIPKEMAWSKYNKYSLDTDLGCCLIVTADFHSLTNKYYKVKISNGIGLSDLPRRGSERKLSEFTNPFGQPLKKNWRVDEMSRLPVYVEKL